MADQEKLKKKLHTSFKLASFAVRREFCSEIVETFQRNNISLSDNFDHYFKRLCDNLEKQCSLNQSIERHNIEQAIEVCLNAGCDKNESVFNVIGAFQFPKLTYNPDRKLHFPTVTKPSLLADASQRTTLFVERYTGVLQRTLRNFKHVVVENENDRIILQTVDFLLTSSEVELNKILILGSLLQVANGKYFLQDPSGMVELDLSHAKYHQGFFVENCFVLVNGYYEDKLLRVSTMVLPPGENYKESRIMFGNINYFGGPSTQPLRDSKNLASKLATQSTDSILFFSDVWLDHPEIFEKLKVLFDGMRNFPPVAFVFMGNFMQELSGSEKVGTLKALFKKFGELIRGYPELITSSKFVFVPGMSDPSSPHIVPRFALPSSITEEFCKMVPKTIFTTNPCRLQYCNQEITVFRADLLVKLMQGTLYKNINKNDFDEYVTRTIVSQGHLSPMSLNALTVHWDFDYTLQLYPLPNLVVIGDKYKAYKSEYKGCQVVNPGSFCEGSFQFTSYVPHLNLLQECELDIS